MPNSPLFQLNQLSIAGVECPAFELHSNDVLSIRGPSGCGKSRLIRSIADLDPNDGDMQLRGEHRSHIPAPQWRQQVMLLPAETAWWADSVAEHFFSMPSAAWLEALGLQEKVFDWDVLRLSSGERQRLGLLRALVNKPQVLLLDEPTANLDEDNVHRVESFLLNYLSEHESAAIWITHDAAQASRIATRHLQFVDSGWRLS